MNNIKNLKFGALLIGASVFSYFFWKENLGLNLLLFTFFLVSGIVLFYFESIKGIGTILTLTGVITSAVFIVINNSLFEKIMYFISFFLLIGFIHQNKLRSLIFALPTAIVSFLHFPKTFFSEIKLKRIHASRIKAAWKVSKLSIIPVFFLLVFFFIFKAANPEFDRISAIVLNKIWELICQIWDAISISRILFFFIGVLIIGGIFYNAGYDRYLKRESGLSDFINRIRRPGKVNPKVQVSLSHHFNQAQPIATGPVIVKRSYFNLKLKYEHISALIMIGLINLLIFIVNCIDINWVWFGFSYSGDLNLSQFVHDGTYLLILSILLSMAIMLYFFRGNLNFFSRNKPLKLFSYVWIAQNVILTISVAIRNYHYIDYCGLAYKRIGLIFFLALVIFGLITLFIKIKETRSGFFLFRVNSWAAYLLMVTMSLVDWDMVIVNHNLGRPKKEYIDVSFLLTLSDKTLPVIDQHKDILQQTPDFNASRTFYPLTYHEVFENRVRDFMQRKGNTTWLSWNKSEDDAYDYFNGAK